MWVPNLLISELLAVDGHSAGAILVCSIASLHHESLYHSVENTAFVVLAETLKLSSAKTPEVFTGLRQFLK